MKLFNSEQREAVGLSGRLLKDLSNEELHELCATYLFDGYDGLKDKYGLSRGEVLSLLSNPQWLQIARSVASNMRANAVTRTLVAMPRLFSNLEAKVAKSPLVEDTINAIRLTKEIFLEVSGQGPTTLVGAHTGAVQPAHLAQDEQAALSELRTHLAALSDAKMISETPISKADSNGSGNGNGNGHSDAA